MAHEFERLNAALADRYTIQRELGRGGMAVVYLAHDRKLDRPVALKVLRPELAASIGAERFVREIEITAKLTHPNILVVHDCGDADGILYYTMPFVEGESLRDKLNREKQLPIDEAVRITLEVADALGHAHTLGIVHRDVKPENILLEVGHAVVSDFGIARAVTAAGGAALTDTGLVVGTPAYMSPEQATGATDIDARSDIYGLACVLFEMLGGEPPYTGPSAQAIVAKKLSEQLPRVRVLRDAVSPEVEQALAKALARVPADRFHSAQEFAAALASPATTSGTTLSGERGGRRRMVAGVAVGGLLLAVVVWAVLAWPLSGAAAASVAALPFANLSGLEDDAYFTEGIHSEILAQLQKVGGLKVISRTSVMGYRDTPKNVRQIGRELDARYLLEGDVRRAAAAVRVNVQLIDSRNDGPVWAESYDTELSMENLLDVQSDIAVQVARALRTQLTPDEQVQLEAIPTTNLDAYQAYLRGQYFMNLPHFTVANLMRAFQEFQRAVELDSTFALVHAELAMAHAQEVYFWVNASEQQRDLATQTIERAVRMDPESPQVRLALGLYHLWVHRDAPRALEQIALAEQGLPNNPRVFEARAWVYELQGAFDEAIGEYEKARELSPRDAGVLTYLSFDHWITRQYDRGRPYADQAINLAPDQVWPNLGKVFLTWSDVGPTQETDAMLEALPHEVGWVLWGRYWQRMMQDRYADALTLLAETDSEWIRLKNWARPKSLFAALTLRSMGRHEEAQQQFEAARRALEPEVESQPYDPRYHSSLGLAYAGLGMREQAVQYGEQAVRLLPVSKDAWYGIPFAWDLAAIHAMLGDTTAAVQQIAYLLEIPSWVSPAWLAVDFRFDDLRTDRRFQAMLAGDQ